MRRHLLHELREKRSDRLLAPGVPLAYGQVGDVAELVVARPVAVLGERGLAGVVLPLVLAGHAVPVPEEVGLMVLCLTRRLTSGGHASGAFWSGRARWSPPSRGGRQKAWYQSVSIADPDPSLAYPAASLASSSP